MMDNMYRLPYGLGNCAVKDCTQMVQDHSECPQEHRFCYFHAKVRDGLISRMMDYYSRPHTEWRYGDWDLEVG